MDNEAHVNLVDAHAECGGCDNNIEAGGIVQPLGLCLFPLGRLHAGMIGDGSNPLSAQTIGERITPIARGCVNYARDAFDASASSLELSLTDGIRSATVLHLLVPIAELPQADIVVVADELDIVMQVLAERSGGEDLQLGWIQAKDRDAVIANLDRSRCGKADDRRVRKFGSKEGQMQVTGSEIVAPFRYAVSFVNSDPRQFALAIDCTHVPSKCFLEAELGGDEQQTDQRMATSEVFQYRSALVVGYAAIDRGYANPRCLQLRDLISHQR